MGMQPHKAKAAWHSLRLMPIRRLPWVPGSGAGPFGRPARRRPTVRSQPQRQLTGKIDLKCTIKHTGTNVTNTLPKRMDSDRWPTSSILSKKRRSSSERFFPAPENATEYAVMKKTPELNRCLFITTFQNLSARVLLNARPAFSLQSVITPKSVVLPDQTIDGFLRLNCFRILWRSPANCLDKNVVTAFIIIFHRFQLLDKA